jgi:hypothetical protein
VNNAEETRVDAEQSTFDFVGLFDFFTPNRTAQVGSREKDPRILSKALSRDFLRSWVRSEVHRSGRIYAILERCRRR